MLSVLRVVTIFNKDIRGLERKGTNILNILRQIDVISVFQLLLLHKTLTVRIDRHAPATLRQSFRRLRLLAIYDVPAALG